MGVKLDGVELPDNALMRFTERNNISSELFFVLLGRRLVTYDHEKHEFMFVPGVARDEALGALSASRRLGVWVF